MVQSLAIFGPLASCLSRVSDLASSGSAVVSFILSKSRFATISLPRGNPARRSEGRPSLAALGDRRQSMRSAYASEMFKALALLPPAPLEPGEDPVSAAKASRMCAGG